MAFVNFLYFLLLVINCLTVENVFASDEGSSRKRAYSVNQSPEKKLKNLCEQDFTSPVACEIQTNIEKIQVTPNDSRTQILRDVVDFALNRLTDINAEPIVQNKQIVNAFISPDKATQRSVSVLNSASRRLSKSDKENISVVDLHHSTTPTIKKDKSGKKDILSGGHKLEDYINSSSSFNVAKNCFIGQDGLTLGINAGVTSGAIFRKTVKKGFDEEDAYNSFKQRDPIAQDNQMIIYSIQKDEFIAAYPNKKSPIKIDTIFPILVARTSKQDKLGNVKIGSFGCFSSDYIGMDSVDTVTMSLAACRSMMKLGIKLQSEPGASELFDVTEQIEAKLKLELDLRNFYEKRLPGKFFILDDASNLIL